MTDKYLRLSLQFHAWRLQRDLARLQHYPWIEHLNRHVHDGGWRALPLRSVDGEVEGIAAVKTDPARYCATRYLAECDYIPEVLASLQCPLMSVRLMSLAAGGEIRRHTDLDLSFEDGSVRLHIPIQTDSQVIFHIDDSPVNFSAGECWYMNANYPHQVSNRSNRERVHLVVDCLVNDWLHEKFMQAGYCKPVVENKYGDPGINDENAPEVIAQLEAMGTLTSLKMAQRVQRIRAGLE